MRIHIILLSFLLIFAVTGICWLAVYEPGLDEQMGDGPDPVFVEYDGEKELYRIGLSDGPLYYYKYPDGTIRVITSTTVKKDIMVG